MTDVNERVKRIKIPVVEVTDAEVKAELDEKIRKFERRYEMASADALQGLSNGQIRETGEILEWLQAYLVRGWLDRLTSTTGTPGIATKLPTKSG